MFGGKRSTVCIYMYVYPLHLRDSTNLVIYTRVKNLKVEILLALVNTFFGCTHYVHHAYLIWYV